MSDEEEDASFLLYARRVLHIDSVDAVKLPKLLADPLVDLFGFSIFSLLFERRDIPKEGPRSFFAGFRGLGGEGDRWKTLRRRDGSKFGLNAVSSLGVWASDDRDVFLRSF